MIPGDLLSAFPHRQFHTLPGLLDSRAALPNSYPNACMPMQGGNLYHFYDGLWYDPAERRTHDLPCERRTRYRLSQPDTVCLTWNQLQNNIFFIFVYWENEYALTFPTSALPILMILIRTDFFKGSFLLSIATANNSIQWFQREQFDIFSKSHLISKGPYIDSLSDASIEIVVHKKIESMSDREPTRWQHNRIYPHPINPCVYTYNSICHLQISI